MRATKAIINPKITVRPIIIIAGIAIILMIKEFFMEVTMIIINANVPATKTCRGSNYIIITNSKAARSRSHIHPRS